MTDRLTREQRSKNMAAVRSRGNNSTEQALVKLFRQQGISGWRRHLKISGIRPDFVFPKHKFVVFAHGCFWHGCKLHRSIPVSNKRFWKGKIFANKKRDLAGKRKLRRLGWVVLCFWEHEIKGKPDKITKKISEAIFIQK